MRKLLVYVSHTYVTKDYNKFINMHNARSNTISTSFIALIKNMILILRQGHNIS